MYVWYINYSHCVIAFKARSCISENVKNTATCSSYKAIGASFDGALRRKPVAGRPRRDRQAAPTPIPRVHIPEEIGIDMDQQEFRQVLRQILQEELGVGEVDLGERWQGGKVVIEPGKEGIQSKEIPLELLFKKIVMVRYKLRVLEQKINTHSKLSSEDKVQMQQYITGCYGTLTTFNVLFKNKTDHFVGQSAKKG